MIALDSWRVPGYETKIKVSMPLPNEDLSGLGSFTLDGEEGVKPAIVNVITKIKFNEANDLEALVTKAKALDDNGARVIYTISSDVTSAYKIRKGKFHGEVSATPHDEQHLWIVQFKLKEQLSTGERVQQQMDGTAAENSTAQATSGHNNIVNAFANVEGP